MNPHNPWNGWAPATKVWIAQILAIDPGEDCTFILRDAPWLSREEALEFLRRNLPTTRLPDGFGDDTFMIVGQLAPATIRTQQVVVDLVQWFDINDAVAQRFHPTDLGSPSGCTRRPVTTNQTDPGHTVASETNTGQRGCTVCNDHLDTHFDNPDTDPIDRIIEDEPVGTDDHTTDNARYGGATVNPNPNRITDALWWFWLRLAELEPHSQLSGIYAFKKGYHSSRTDNQRNWPNNYSIRETEDLDGPADKAAALDWTFPNAQRGDYSTIAVYTKRLISSGKDRDDPRLDGLREVYGQADSDAYVEGWDCRHLIDSTADAAHRWHSHFPFDRNKVTMLEVMDAVLSVLKGEPLTQWRERTSAPPAPDPAPMLTGNPPGSRVLWLTNPVMTGDDVRFVQRWIGPRQAGAADGEYGPRTEAGVRWYQNMRNDALRRAGLPLLQVDGRVGRHTWAQMGVTVRPGV